MRISFAMKPIVTVCVLTLLLSACGAATAPTATPTATATQTPTPVPTNTATLIPSATPTPTDAPPTEIPSETPIPVDPLLDLAIPPPLEIVLPPEWQFGYDTVLYRDVDGQTDSVPFALYTGPVTDGIGTIVLVWGFDSVTGILPNEFGQRNIYLDALRILRTVIFDPRCNIGTAPEREYMVGNANGTGTSINVNSCPDGQPDTRGWIAAIVLENINFAFYIFIDPIPPVDHPSETEIQAILDSIVFSVDDFLIDSETLAATREALRLTLTPTGN